MALARCLDTKSLTITLVMNKFIIIILSLSTFLLSSCSEEEMIERREDRIIGTWQFEKAFFHGHNALFRDNISYRYENDQISFLSDYTCTWYDAGKQVTYHGDWFVELEVFTDPDGAENVFFLDALFYGESQDEDFGFYAEVEWLTKNSMTISFNDQDGEYTYRLNKR